MKAERVLLSELGDSCRGNGSAAVAEVTGESSTSVTFREIGDRAADLKERLSESGLRRGQVVGLVGANAIGWIVWDLAVMFYGAVIKAFPADVAVDSAEAFIEANGLALLVTDRNELAAQSYCAPLDDLRIAKGSRLRIRAAGQVLNDPDIHSLVYSSGSSGRLKGLIMSRKGSEHFISRFLDSFMPDGGKHTHLMFLPLSSYQQRLTLYGCLHTGCELVMVPYQRVFQLLPVFRPTFLIAPPVFYNTLLQLTETRLLGTSLAACLGGNLRFAITGMAPISPRTVQTFWDAGVKLLEVYGMNECGMISWNTERAHKHGSVGRPVGKEHFRIDEEGEILIRHPYPLSLGYFDSSSEDSAATFLQDGSIATGDFGKLDEDGFLSLLGRKKDMVVLPNGQKFHPAEAEGILAGVEGVKEAVIVYDELGTKVVAIVVPDENARKEEEKFKARILQKNGELTPHKRFSRLLIHDSSITGDRRFTTRNMKLNRRAIYESLVRSR